MAEPHSALVPVATDIEKRDQKTHLAPLTRGEVNLMESRAHALGLPSLLSLATGVEDEDIPFPYEMRLDELGLRLEDAIMAEQYAEGDDEWD